MPDTKANVSQSEIGQNRTAMNVIPTSDAELGQQMLTDVPLSEVQYPDVKSDIPYAPLASGQCHDTEEHTSEVSTL